MVMIEGIERRTLDSCSAGLTRIKANLAARSEASGKGAK
jgi:hypothetical protein